MRIETAKGWMMVGFCLLTVGMLLHMTAVIGGELTVFLATMGLVYLTIGLVLTLVHDKHMAKRTRAGDNE
jgi:hypothetical protein